LSLGTLDPHQILVGDLATHSPTVSYYPLALHLSAAVVAGLTGASVSAVLTIGYVLASSVVLPLGIYVLSRRLFAGIPFVPGMAAVILAGMPLYPHGVIVWGGITTLIGMSMLLPVVEAAWLSSADSSYIRSGGLLGVACFGLFTTHNSELIAAAVIAFLLVLGGWREMSRERRRHQLISWALSVALFAALIAPQLSALAEGSTERSGLAAQAPRIGSVAVLILVVLNALVLLFAVPGAVVAFRRKWARGWLWSLAAVAAIGLIAELRIPGLVLLTSPWYSSPSRILYLWAYFGASYAAVGVVLGLPVLSEILSRRFAVRPSIAAVLGPAIAAIAFLAAAIVPGEHVASLAYAQSSLIGPDQRAGFGWLARHTASGDRVLNDFSDGSGWMGTLAGVTPVFQTKVSQTNETENPWGDRWYLLTHASNLSDDIQARDAVRQWRVKYVYVNGRYFYAKSNGLLDASRLSASPAYRRVWARGTVTIFEVVSA
jgi:hypothetical protein